MIEVIKHGKKKFTAICSICGCEFAYELSDLDPLGGIHCPDCCYYVVHERRDDIQDDYKQSIKQAKIDVLNELKKKKSIATWDIDEMIEELKK